MWCLVIEIPLFLVGMFALISGRLPLASEARLHGWRARLAGGCLAVPLPLSLGTGLLTGVLIGVGLIPAGIERYVTVLEFAIHFAGLLAVTMLALIRPPERSTVVPLTAEASQELAEGRRWMEFKYIERARACFERARALAPTHPDPHAGLAEVWASVGRWDETATELQTALELDPHRTDLHVLAAEAYSQLGQEERAERERQIAARLSTGGKHNKS